MATTTELQEDNQLRHRVTEEIINKTGNDVDDATTKNKTPIPTTTTTPATATTKRAAMARRGLRSLAIAVVIPISLTFISRLIHLSHHKPNYLLLISPSVIHTFFALSSLLMGLSAWLVWADGGFHRKPITLGFYMTHLALTLAWDPVLLGFIGLVVSVAMLVALTGCATTFRQVKPLAGDLALVGVLWGGVIVGLNLMHVYRRRSNLV